MSRDDKMKKNAKYSGRTQRTKPTAKRITLNPDDPRGSALRLTGKEWEETLRKIEIDTGDSTSKRQPTLEYLQDQMARFEFVLRALEIEEEHGPDSTELASHLAMCADFEAEKLWFLETIAQIRSQKSDEKEPTE